MKQLRVFLLAAAVLIAGASAARAQVIGGKKLKHGDVVMMNRDGKDVKATVVYQDAKTGNLWVREKPGKAPVSVARDDIRPVAGSAEKGGIVPGVYVGEADPNYEIYVMEVWNGPIKSVRYISKSLSPGEQQQLAELQRAANEAADSEMRVQDLKAKITKETEDPTPKIESETITTQSSLNNMPVWYYPVNYYYYYPVNYYFSYYPPLATPYGYGYGYGYPGAYSPNGGGNSVTTTVKITPPPPPSLDDMRTALAAAETQMAKARQQYTAARSHAITDERGRIIAVSAK